MKRNFPFKQISPLDIPRPMLPIVIRNRKTGDSIFAWGLIDTGADSCAIPAKYAGILGHRLKAGAKINIGTGNGSTCAYVHTTEIDILNVDAHGNVEPDIDKSFSIPETKIHYMPKLDTILLGVNNFLSNFILTVDYPGKSFSLSKK
ncbi:MAG TPA: hypothetical protein DET40_22550 [Lentisphaeria bacterium]|nr:MAG: hypothetical protein A2X45_17280 [Lentisphaerae bacterium GWF2_50_93]HCE46336.1 hypothetical protein [Lentisphaeria bacterium]